MQALTLGIAIVASAFIFILSPLRGLLVYIVVSVWYPGYLTVKLGTLDFSVPRIVIIAIYANIFLHSRLIRQFRFIWLDKIIILFFVAQVVAGITTTPLMMLLENRSGMAFDAVLPYFAIRMIITTKQQYLNLLKGVLFISGFVAISGFYQSLTGRNPVGFLQKYHAWQDWSGYGENTGSENLRLGFHRARFTFSNSIVLGLYFSMIGPICTGLWSNVKKNRWLVIIGLCLMPIGTFSSVSSGPFLAAFIALMFLAFYYWRRYWRPVVVLIIVMFGLIEIISNRHFWEVIDRFTLSSQTAWYRAQLIEVGLFKGGMSGHWITGYGFEDPRWCDRIDQRDHTDMVNHYLLILARFGLVGLIPFCIMIVLAFKKLIEANRLCILEEDKWMIWCIAASLTGLLVSLFAVSLSLETTKIFYIMMGFCGVMPSIMRNGIMAKNRLVVNRVVERKANIYH
ncbi:MAG: hypothetical protein AMJ79_00360 [Phycisphaerae bacterium SM23_30]|nr:MAG: hypothetical protein AMJ79_00360 [Phycisphaerae bacterium SM23_30]